MRNSIFALAAILLAACSQQPAADPAEKVADAWIRLPSVADRPGAAYFTLNGDEGDDALLAIDSPAADRAELHETAMADGHMTMQPIGKVDLASGESVVFAPGGKHAMLFGMRDGIAPGDRIPLNFRFDSGRDIQVEAVTVGAGDPAPFEAAEDR